ncbi:hypothetical protein A2929_04140 [Candidatus Kaiserbacteria bacterium RIFCSPLOWO2_01_FULL_45_25]|uniref:Uncharacterized protein n=1 Tax=Candidatus Kaiserbacteria bacterium RIFCSPLOWO2_12_FULL_45_26 TaxID=1798525 RepID=A0A1F6FF62_9BACT|nr:MAG: hypothetical protein A2Z56_01585 [Candidatus Kaiserbacteria bacterium RIFCSPHIGHO2_12_45_16]OGG70238.1 MAG: hypothetical protein A2929_04140 [Candidatus Kaiserbacteria bacterium RIFCSPLOWO2_01_FULL_45_25]OGG84501.1 MAG: hypothetical protein A3G90_00185 [Candidatus Kaiserbacteria bacterium RIFCSPLOWO2_12_FULL_45_26]
MPQQQTKEKPRRLWRRGGFRKKAELTMDQNHVPNRRRGCAAAQNGAVCHNFRPGKTRRKVCQYLPRQPQHPGKPENNHGASQKNER